MRRHTPFFLFREVYAFFFITVILLSAQPCFAQRIKKPAVSGSFYPDSAKILARTINQFLSWAQVERKNRRILAVISPHAGYDYSGSTAAYSYKAVQGASYNTVVIIGPSHFVNFSGVSVYPHGAWQTPLGNVEIDTQIAAALLSSHPKISFNQAAFDREHSLEVQLPYLQMVLDDFKIVPIVTGRLSYADCRMLSEALQKAIGKRKDVLIVASTDMSHRHPYAEACRIDRAAIKALEKRSPSYLYEKLAQGEYELCGGDAVVTTLLYARAEGARDIDILNYTNSGEITGYRQDVVGYMSALIYAPETTGKTLNNSAKEERMPAENRDILNKEQKKKLLGIARRAIEDYLRSKQTIRIQETDPVLLKEMGAFVTVHNQGMLRGCIGNIIGRQALYLTVRDMAIAAVSSDMRFTPVTADELDKIDIEISVLSEPRRVGSADEIKLGVHGVIVKKGYHSGVFLPQVAEETGWTKEEFLSNLCAHKAGLAPSAWKDKDTELYTFTAQVFGEKD